MVSAQKTKQKTNSLYSKTEKQEEQENNEMMLTSTVIHISQEMKCKDMKEAENGRYFGG